MGGKYLIWWSGADDIYNTLDDSKRTLYLTSSAVLTYESLGEQEIRLELIGNPIDDNIINVFNLQYATTAQIGASYQENLEYFLLLGYTREQAVAKAQASIGITKEQMIAKLDEFQADIIESKAASIEAAAEEIQRQTTTQDFTEINDLGDIVNTIDITRSDPEAVAGKVYTYEELKEQATIAQNIEPDEISYIPSDIVTIPQTSPINLGSVGYGTVEQNFKNANYVGGKLSASVQYNLTKDIPTTIARSIFIVRDNRGVVIAKREYDVKLLSSDTLHFNIIIGAPEGVRNVNIEHYFLRENTVLSNSLKQSVTWYASQGGDPINGYTEPINDTISFLESNKVPITLGVGIAAVFAVLAVAKRKKA